MLELDHFFLTLLFAYLDTQLGLRIKLLGAVQAQGGVCPAPEGHELVDKPLQQLVGDGSGGGRERRRRAV